MNGFTLTALIERGVWRQLLTLGVAFLGGLAMSFVGFPLPWIMGAMLSVAALSLAGGAARQPAFGRRAAQVAIGTGLGLYFTQEVIREVAAWGHWMLLGAVFATAMSMFFARVMQRLAGVDGTTAIYAVALGASSEMTIQAQKAGADGAVVASAHSLRVILVVSSASMIAHWHGAGGVQFLASTAAEITLPYALLFCFAAPMCGWLLDRLGTPNAWVLGPLFLAAAFAASGLHARLYQSVLVAAQLLIGWGLGQHMTREFFMRSPRILFSAATVTLSMLLICFGVASLVASRAGIPLLTAFLSVAPGGIAEMAIIAKTFGIGAPLVTAFHFCRIMSTIFLTKRVATTLLRSGWVRP
jgi:membrane AbrB-like protein